MENGFRKVTFIVLLFLLWECQDLSGQVGIKFGVCISNFYYTDKNLTPDFGYEIDLRPMLGYDIQWKQFSRQKAVINPNLSLFYDFPLSEKIIFKPEIVFIQKGVDFSDNDPYKSIYKIKASYLESGASMLYKPVSKENFSFSGYLGSYVAYRLSANKKKGSPVKMTEETAIQNMANFDWGMHAGMIFSPSILGQTIHFDMRIFLGLQDIYTKPKNQIEIYHKLQETKITGINLNVAYVFS